MTKDQYEKYQKLSEEMEPVKDFLFWCGEKYNGRVVAKHPFSIKMIRKRFSLFVNRYWCNEKDNTFDIPLDLQNKIIEIMEQYIDEKEREMKEI